MVVVAVIFVASILTLLLLTWSEMTYSLCQGSGRTQKQNKNTDGFAHLQ